MGFHLTNVLLHSLTVALFFFFLRKFDLPVKIAFICALIYGLHPIHSEPVSAINGRHSLLAGIFCLLAVLTHLKQRRLLCFLCTMAALLSRETSVMIVPALVLVDFCFNKSKSFDFKRLLSNYSLPCLAIMIYFFLRFKFIGGLGRVYDGDISTGDYVFSRRIFMQPVYLFEYFKMIFWPFDLHFWRQIYFPTKFSDPRFLTPFIAFCSYLGLTWFLFRNSLKAFLGTAWFILFLIPVLNLFVIVNSPVLEHWLYIPYMGIVLVVAVVWHSKMNRTLEHKIVSSIASMALLLFLSYRSIEQNKVWKDDLALLEHTTKYVKYDPTVYNYLGTTYLKLQRWEDAEKAFLTAIEIDPKYVPAKSNLMLARQKRLPQSSTKTLPRP